MTEKILTFNAPDGKQIYYYKWLPNSEPWLIVQIAHGMAEHAARYRDFAQFLTQNGIAVYANDHRGHGLTDKDTGNLGFFAEKKGWLKVLSDMNQLSRIIRQDYPDKKRVLFGHSMGSLLARAYIVKYPGDFSGVILSGTSGQSGLVVSAGKFIAWTQGLFSGKHKPSKLLNNMTFKDYNKAIKRAKTDFDWLSKDPEQVQKYIDDPLCGFVVSNRFYYDLLSLVQFIAKPHAFRLQPEDLPVFIISGAEDPVGEMGKGVEKVYKKYLLAGGRNVEMKLYDGFRHEILNEVNKQQVYNDILDWLESNFKSKNE